MDINNFFSFLSSIDVLGLVYVCMVTVQCDSKGKGMGSGSPSFGSPSRVHYLIQSKSQKVKTLPL